MFLEEASALPDIGTRNLHSQEWAWCWKPKSQNKFNFKAKDIFSYEEKPQKVKQSWSLTEVQVSFLDDMLSQHKCFLSPHFSAQEVFNYAKLMQKNLSEAVRRLNFTSRNTEKPGPDWLLFANQKRYT